MRLSHTLSLSLCASPRVVRRCERLSFVVQLHNGRLMSAARRCRSACLRVCCVGTYKARGDA